MYCRYQFVHTVVGSYGIERTHDVEDALDLASWGILPYCKYCGKLPGRASQALRTLRSDQEASLGAVSQAFLFIYMVVTAGLTATF